MRSWEDEPATSTAYKKLGNYEKNLGGDDKQKNNIVFVKNILGRQSRTFKASVAALSA